MDGICGKLVKHNKNKTNFKKTIFFYTIFKIIIKLIVSFPIFNVIFIRCNKFNVVNFNNYNLHDKNFLDY